MVLNKDIIGGLRIYTNDTQQAEEPSLPSGGDETADVGGEYGAAGDMSNLMRESGFLWDRLVPVNDIQNGYDFAYDYTSQYIYWLEHNTTWSSVDIQKVRFDGEERSILASNDLVDHEHFDAVFTFEFDPASRNLFVANMYQSRIEVISIETKHRTLIYSGSSSDTGVGRPGSIAINSADAEVYWIDNGFEAVPIKIGSCLYSL